ncbi:MAG: ATP-grasp domain-containing protein [Smithellaceae bacterium]
MLLIESDGKKLLARHGIPVPRSELIRENEHPHLPRAKEVVVKAQLLSGGRGKAGLVRVVPAADMPATAELIRTAMRENKQRPILLIEEKIAFVDEYYLACRIDDVAQKIELLFSRYGGVEIEAHSDTLCRYAVDPLRGAWPHELVSFFRDAGVRGAVLGSLCRLAAQLCRVFIIEDAELIEINPLGVQEKGRVILLDAKVILNDSAASRHSDWAGLLSASLASADLSELEQKGVENGITFVDLPGNIALITAGAGLGMLVADLVVDNGWHPANFVDIMGGSSRDKYKNMVENVFDRARRSDVKGIIAYFALRFTRVDDVVHGLLDALKISAPPKPMVVGLEATGAATLNMSVEEGHRVLKTTGLPCFGDLAEAIVRLKTMI